MEVIAAYRRSGAELPFGDLRCVRGAPFEGWFWRFTDPRGERVAIAYCGVSRDGSDASWGTVGLATHPGGRSRSALTKAARAAIGGLRISAADAHSAFDADPTSVAVRLGDHAVLTAGIKPVLTWPDRAFGACGPAHLLPALSQLWHPYMLHGRASGHAEIDGERLTLDGWDAYAEKSWGPGGFPETWWWGQAHGFSEPVSVAFAGGTVRWGPLRTYATALVVALDGHIVHLVAPSALVRADVTTGSWRIEGRSARHRIVVEGHANGSAPCRLPVPLPRERRHHAHAATQHLAGEMTVRVDRGRRCWFEGSSRVAGLETGSLSRPAGA